VKILVLLVFILLNISLSKEILTEDKLKNFMTEDNPNIYSILGKKYIYKAKIKYFKGNFDTKLKASYEEKNYPISKGKYYDFFIEKPIFYGFDLKAGYRYAEGVQEYNNIKTSKEGEAVIGLSLPVINLISQIDIRRLNLFKARNFYKNVDFETKDKLRKFYFKVLKTYYKTVFYKKVFKLEKQLLEKAKKRLKFIKRKIEEGLLPQIYLVEANQHIVNRRQRLLKAKNEYQNSLNELLTLLNLNKEEFNKKYTLPEDLKLPTLNISFEEALNIAKQNRPDLFQFKYQMKILNLEEKYYRLLSYPNINLDMYMTKDFKYDYGFKFVLNADYYIERRKYLGKMVEIKKGKALIKNKYDSKIMQINVKIKNIFNTLKTLQQNIQNAKNEVSLVQKLENAERRKFILGRSDLFYLNQREIYTLKTIKKYLYYKFDYIVNYKKLFIELGVF